MKLYDIPQIDGKLYLRDETDLWGFIQNNEYEPEETKLIKSLVKSNDVCLDIGANIGYFTVLMAKQCKAVCAIEPERSNFELLIKNTDVNNLRNVWRYNYALVEYPQAGGNRLYLCLKSHGMHRVYPSKHCDSDTICHGVRYDDLEFTNIINFIKMDIEGAELGALHGMKQMLQRDMPTMVMEFHPPSIIEYGANPKDIYDFLTELKYDIRLVPNIDETISYQDLYDKTNNESGGQNILCQKK
jgi:FkbM family methyltransferase